MSWTKNSSKQYNDNNPKYSMEYCEELCIKPLLDTNKSYNSSDFKSGYLIRKTCIMQSPSSCYYNQKQGKFDYKDYVGKVRQQIKENVIWSIFDYMDIPCLLEYHFERLFSDGLLFNMYTKRDALSIKSSYNRDILKDKEQFDELVKLSNNICNNDTIEDHQQLLDICKYFNDRNGKIFLRPLSEMKKCYDGFEKISSDEWIDLYKHFNVVDDNTTQNEIRDIILRQTDNSNKQSIPKCIESGMKKVVMIDANAIEKIVQNSKSNHSFVNNNNGEWLYPSDAESKLSNLKFNDIIRLVDKHINMRNMNISIPYSKLNLDGINIEDTLFYKIKGMKQSDALFFETPNNGYYSMNSWKQLMFPTEIKNNLRIDDSADSTALSSARSSIKTKKSQGYFYQQRCDDSDY